VRVAARGARVLTTVVVAIVAFVATTAPAWAQGDPEKKGELAGNLPLTVYLLIPLALLFALVTAIVLGPLGEPPARAQRSGRVSRKLSERDASGDQPSS